jgi:hypothetical protein
VQRETPFADGFLPSWLNVKKGFVVQPRNGRIIHFISRLDILLEKSDLIATFPLQEGVMEPGPGAVAGILHRCHIANHENVRKMKGSCSP